MSNPHGTVHACGHDCEKGDNFTTPSELITFGPVHLDISNLERSIMFWRDLVGLHVLEATAGTAALGVDDAPLVVLHASATRPVQRGYSGLYHFAINLPSEPDLARVLARVRASGRRYGASDHMVAKSIYLHDPDGIGLEITFETPDRVQSFRWDKGTESPLVIDAEGRKRSGVEPLDVEEVLAVLPDRDVMLPVPSGTIVGHLQFQVGNLETSYQFYRDKIGLIQSIYAPWARYGDLGAGGRVGHRIALNMWHGIGAPPRASGVAGLRSFTMRFASQERLRDAVARIGNAELYGRDYAVHDPDGNALFMVFGLPTSDVDNSTRTEIFGKDWSS
jgi:catechol 2,3-dioxygenase